MEWWNGTMEWNIEMTQVTQMFNNAIHPISVLFLVNECMNYYFDDQEIHDMTVNIKHT